MRAICPNNREHDLFITTAHVMQDWEVDHNGVFLRTVDSCVQVDVGPDRDNIWNCSICGAEAITRGEIVELYATVLEGDEDSYLDIYDNYEDAKKEVGTYVDGVKVIDVKKGYSIAPKGLKTLYDDAPDFCNTRSEAYKAAFDLEIDL